MIDESLTAEIFSNELQAEISLGGASDYEQLENKPKINGITLSGNKTGGALGVVNEPPSEGTNGQVLATNGSGARYWKTISGGGVGETDFEALDNRPLYNGNVMSHSTDIPEVKTATWDAKYDKPSGGIPKTDLANAVQTSLGKADTALQEHQSLSAYRTASAQDQIDAAQTSAISQHTSQITALQTTDTNIFGTSDAWANNASYTAGNYRIYSNALYRCILAHSTSTATTILPTNTAYWKKVSLSELSTQKMGMPDYNNPILNLGINDITTSTVSWTATENCIVYFTLFPTNPRNIYVSINNVTMYYGGYIYNTDASAQIGKCFFSHNVILRTGDTVKFDNIDASGARSNSIRAYKCI